MVQAIPGLLAPFFFSTQFFENRYRMIAGLEELCGIFCKETTHLPPKYDYFFIFL